MFQISSSLQKNESKVEEEEGQKVEAKEEEDEGQVQVEVLLRYIYHA